MYLIITVTFSPCINSKYRGGRSASTNQVRVPPENAAALTYSSLPGPDSQNLSPKLPPESLDRAAIPAFCKVPMLPQLRGKYFISFLYDVFLKIVSKSHSFRAILTTYFRSSSPNHGGLPATAFSSMCLMLEVAGIAT